LEAEALIEIVAEQNAAAARAAQHKAAREAVVKAGVTLHPRVARLRENLISKQ
jgi:hypothetical protein